jgi:hypothetical protein
LITDFLPSEYSMVSLLLMSMAIGNFYPPKLQGTSDLKRLQECKPKSTTLTTWYSFRSSSRDTSIPSLTFPKKEQRPLTATLENWFVTTWDQNNYTQTQNKWSTAPWRNHRSDNIHILCFLHIPDYVLKNWNLHAVFMDELATFSLSSDNAAWSIMEMSVMTKWCTAKWVSVGWSWQQNLTSPFAKAEIEIPNLGFWVVWCHTRAH